MQILYLEPLKKAWGRMKIALFKPFNITKWFVMGFSAFLAGLLDGNKGTSGFQWDGDDTSFKEIVHFPDRAWEWLVSHPGWFLAISIIALLAIAIVIVLLWVSSRGKFMFLDNVVRDKAEIVKPWNKYKNEGDSLFLWRLVFGLICFISFLLFIIFIAVKAVYLHETSDPAFVLFLILGILLFFIMILIVAYISIFLDSFVVPIMYKKRIKVTKAWGDFLALFRKYFIYFILYGLFLFLLIILFGIFIVVAGLLTCCVGFILLVIPYIGTVITLPFWYLIRAFSVEYLTQFSDEYKLLTPLEKQTKSQD